jgi:hypothetical protein
MIMLLLFYKNLTKLALGVITFFSRDSLDNTKLIGGKLVCTYFFSIVK